MKKLSTHLHKFPMLTLLILLILGSGCKKEGEQVPGHELSTGASARELVSGKFFKKLELEILHHPNSEPSASTISRVQEFLQNHIDKPEGINISLRALPTAQQSDYSINSLLALEAAHRTKFNEKGVMSLCLLLVDGDFSETNQVLGVAYRNTTMALFHRTIRRHSGGLGQPQRSILETTVILHELGHVFGLVNNGAAMQQAHQDVAHGKHCNDNDCLMFYAVETTDFLGNLLGGQIPALDAQCLDDLNALK
ncbi:MAG: hypothetical protein ACK417_02595 [Bacteroidia bacterium]